MRASFFCAVSLFGLTSCSPAYLEQRTDESQNAADVIRSADLRPKFPAPVRKEAGGSDARGGGFTLFGSAAPATTAEAPADAPADAASESGGGYTLNFDNSPVANVAKVVLGDILSLRYAIDPRAQGTISLSSSQPIAKRDLLFVLESALRANNLALIRESGGYRISALGEGGAIGATDRADAADAASPGYGMTVIPLRYVSATTLVRLLEGFATRPGTVRADPSGHLILVLGTGEERRSTIDTIRQFDVDWMRNQSVGLYPVHNGSSSTIAGELEKIMDSGEAGLGHGLVKLQDISAQNAVLVVAARPAMLATAARWIERLDSPNLSGAGVHSYKVRYGDAKQMAHLLNTMFGAGGEAGETDANQLAPGAGAKTLSAADRLTGGGQQPASSTGAGLNGAAGNAALGNPAGLTKAPSAFGGLQTAALGAAFAEAGQGGGGNSVMPGVRITADVANNSVLVYGSADNFNTVERALQQMDRPKAQVAIDVTIAEVTLNDQLNYGVQFYLANHVNMASVGNTSGTPPLSSNSLSSGFNVIVGNSLTPHVIINALHQLTDVKILSNPSLVVVDNQEATLEVGDQVPVSTGSATVLSSNNAIVNTIDYKNTGIILDVVPRVSPDNTIQLDIAQEISNVVNGTNGSSVGTGATTPTISERKVKSQITVASGQMVLLAGLVSETQTKSRSGVPGFDQLPLVGGAFGSSDKEKQRTELIILIRPQVIRDSVDASRVAEQLRAKMRGGRIDAISIPNALQVGAKRTP